MQVRQARDYVVRRPALRASLPRAPEPSPGPHLLLVAELRAPLPADPARTPGNRLGADSGSPISEIITGKKEITRESAAQIAAALGHSLDTGWQLQDDYLLHEQEKDSATQRVLRNVRRRARLNELAPMSVLLKHGIIRGRTLDDQEAEIMRLYELNDISDDPAFALAARRSNPSEVLSAL